FRSALMLVGVIGLLEVPGWAQCVMCGTALASSPEGRALASSFRYGIVILMVAPYLILGSIGYAIFRAYRKRRDLMHPKALTVGAVYDRARSPR
ncbi:MAG TPA: hypothetical protein VN496_00700, partial [Burkholderiales bacterium]|nr:hypothetical protein [Burkholderiales bacterium]